MEARESSLPLVGHASAYGLARMHSKGFQVSSMCSVIHVLSLALTMHQHCGVRCKEMNNSAAALGNRIASSEEAAAVPTHLPPPLPPVPPACMRAADATQCTNNNSFVCIQGLERRCTRNQRSFTLLFSRPSLPAAEFVLLDQSTSLGCSCRQWHGLLQQRRAACPSCARASPAGLPRAPTRGLSSTGLL